METTYSLSLKGIQTTRPPDNLPQTTGAQYENSTYVVLDKYIVMLIRS